MFSCVILLLLDANGKTTQRTRRPEDLVPFSAAIIFFKIAPEEEEDFVLPVEVQNKLHDYEAILFN